MPPCRRSFRLARQFPTTSACKHANVYQHFGQYLTFRLSGAIRTNVPHSAASQFAQPFAAKAGSPLFLTRSERRHPFVTPVTRKLPFHPEEQLVAE